MALSQGVPKLKVRSSRIAKKGAVKGEYENSVSFACLKTSSKKQISRKSPIFPQVQEAAIYWVFDTFFVESTL